MKNILFHFGEFWFNEDGFTENPGYPCLDCKTMDCPAKECTERYEEALRLDLADSVKFADQDAIRIAICELQPNKGPDYYQFKPVEDQTFFIEGIEVQCQIMIKTQWRQIPCMYFKNETRPKRKVAVLSNNFENQRDKLRAKMKNVNSAIDNSSVKSETPKFETLDEHEAYLKGLSDAKPKTYEEWKEQGKQLFTDRLQPKAKPTVEGEAWRVEPKFYKFGKYREVIINGKLTLCGNISFSKLRTICALLNRAPLGEETKEKKP